MEIVEDAPTADVDESEEWTMAIDRGGLKHIDDNTYMVFATMELVLRQYLSSKKASEIPGLQEVTEKMTSCEDVLFHWSMVSVNWGEEESRILLHMIAEHWLKLRGFSFASALVEKYKQTQKKSIQKSKALRKQL